MRVAHTTAEIRRQLARYRGRKTIAFVPTMGCLHEGHMSLVRKAKKEADIVVVSIYINPLQFAPNEDLEHYPRTFEADARLCEAEGVDYIFHPATLYPRSGPRVTLKATRLSDCLCGASRSGHFDGVVTVVNILFNIIQPDIAIFGEKDWQQLAVIRRMVRDLQIPVEVIGVETKRESDGLARSSRNRYLSGNDRLRATAISQALMAMQKQAAAGEKNVERLIAAAETLLAKQGIEAEYLEVRSARSLKAKRKLNARQPARAFIAARVGNARLIDNMPLELGPAHSTEELQ